MPRKKRNSVTQTLKRLRDKAPNYTFAQFEERLQSELRSGSPVPFVCTITDDDSRPKYFGISVPVALRRNPR